MGMLVVSRFKDESVQLGGEHTLPRMLTEQEYEALLIAGVGMTPLSTAVRKVIDLLMAPVHVTVLDIRGDKVRLGVTAAKALPVDREEIADSKRWEREAREEYQQALAGKK